ncbi:MAG: hypothetical protein ACR5LA_02975 [Wolbachia sp.]
MTFVLKKLLDSSIKCWNDMVKYYSSSLCPSAYSVSFKSTLFLSSQCLDTGIQKTSL